MQSGRFCRSGLFSFKLGLSAFQESRHAFLLILGTEQHGPGNLFSPQPALMS